MTIYPNSGDTIQYLYLTQMESGMKNQIGTVDLGRMFPNLLRYCSSIKYSLDKQMVIFNDVDEQRCDALRGAVINAMFDGGITSPMFLYCKEDNTLSFTYNMLDDTKAVADIIRTLLLNYPLTIVDVIKELFLKGVLLKGIYRGKSDNIGCDTIDFQVFFKDNVVEFIFIERYLNRLYEVAGGYLVHNGLVTDIIVSSHNRQAILDYCSLHGHYPEIGDIVKTNFKSDVLVAIGRCHIRIWNKNTADTLNPIVVRRDDIPDKTIIGLEVTDDGFVVHTTEPRIHYDLNGNHIETKAY